MLSNYEFSIYVKKFEKRYFVKTDGDGILFIGNNACRIAPYSPEKRLLGIWRINMAPRKKKSILKRLKPFLVEVHQDCDFEFGAYFHEQHLDSVAKIVKVKRRRQLTDKQR